MRRVLLSAIVLVGCLCSIYAQDKDWKKRLQEQLDTAYPARKMGGWMNNTVKEPGITLTVAQVGLLGDCPNQGLFLETARVTNGKITNPKSSSAPDEYLYPVGEEVFVRGIRVHDNDITFIVKTVNPVPVRKGGKLQCESSVVYNFEKDYLKNADFAAIQREVGTVLATADQAASANMKTIELGQTIEQVEGILGKPEKVVKLGEKTTYVYKDMKVIFLNGKVSDVQ